jgi:crossover junction endodeoxyribonuclease RuvC
MFARALGIDPGLVRTGWAVIESADGGRRGPTVLGHGVITPLTDAELPLRLADGARRLREVVAEYRPDFVALEEVFTAPRHPRSALLMAHMRGAFCLVLAEAGVPIVPLTATTVKQRLTSGGHASKEQVQRMVLRLTGFEPTGRMKLDETDAMALALAGLHTEVRGAWSEHHTKPRSAAAIRELIRERQRV